MDPLTSQKIATSIRDLHLDYAVSLIWHGGEPLMTGHKRFLELVEPFEDLRKDNKIVHGVQTNGTRIDSEWCSFFKEYSFEVGVSIDGPSIANHNRVDWQNRPSFDRVMQGIDTLVRENVPFTCIAVVTDDVLDKAFEMYRFFQELGCVSFGINPEEKIGINQSMIDDDSRISRFWRDLFEAWKIDPTVQVREFKNVLHWMGAQVGEFPPIPYYTDIFPTISWKGDIVLLSPEFLSAHSSQYDSFVVGNILDNSLSEILVRGQHITYVQDYLAGVRKCRDSCQFFDYCRGGQAANKFFELGSLNATETRHCRNSHQKPLEVLMAYVENS